MEHCLNFLILRCFSVSNLHALFSTSLLSVCRFEGKIDEYARCVFTSGEPDDQLSLILVQDGLHEVKRVVRTSPESDHGLRRRLEVPTYQLTDHQVFLGAKLQFSELDKLLQCNSLHLRLRVEPR